jgi:hypothetical protein
MKRGSVRVGLAAAAVALGGGAACGAASTARDRAASAMSASPAAHVVTEPVYLDSSTLFSPPPDGATPKLDAKQAFDAFAGDDRAIPDHLDYQLGLFTSPPSVTDVLVWGYHLDEPSQCVTTGMIKPERINSTQSPSEPQKCIQWEFIDANTGHFVQGMGQVVSGPDSVIPTPPPPAGTEALADGGALPPRIERFSPDLLVVQAPLSTIRWTFDMAECDIELHWFLPPDDARSDSAARPCRAAGKFSLDATADFTSRGRVFAVVAGHIAGPFDAPRYLVRVILDNGRSQIFDPDEDNRAWVFPVQRCGDFAGTLPVAVEAVKFDGETVIDRLAVPATAFERQSPADCEASGEDDSG